jgi:hypothetical protein
MGTLRLLPLRGEFAGKRRWDGRLQIPKPLENASIRSPGWAKVCRPHVHRSGSVRWRARFPGALAPAGLNRQERQRRRGFPPRGLPAGIPPSEPCPRLGAPCGDRACRLNPCQFDARGPPKGNAIPIALIAWCPVLLQRLTPQFQPILSGMGPQPGLLGSGPRTADPSHA